MSHGMTLLRTLLAWVLMLTAAAPAAQAAEQVDLLAEDARQSPDGGVGGYDGD